MLSRSQGTPAPRALLSSKTTRRASPVPATSGKAAPTKTNPRMFFSGKPDDDDTERNAIFSVSGRGKSRRTVIVKDQSRVLLALAIHNRLTKHK